MTEKDVSKQKNEVSEDIKQLVITRIGAQMSSNLRLSIGDKGSLDRDEMIEHIKRGDEIGRQIINSHLNFIKAQASGKLISALNSVE